MEIIIIIYDVINLFYLFDISVLEYIAPRTIHLQKPNFVNECQLVLIFSFVFNFNIVSLIRY